MGRFRPTLASRDGDINTELTHDYLVDALILDHMNRSTIPRTVDDYRVEDYTDEFRIYVNEKFGYKGERWRLLFNFQYEGYD
jgi:hypothetical protein